MIADLNLLLKFNKRANHNLIIYFRFIKKLLKSNLYITTGLTFIDFQILS